MPSKALHILCNIWMNLVDRVLPIKHASDRGNQSIFNS
jgi:hypothetical protein